MTAKGHVLLAINLAIQPVMYIYHTHSINIALLSFFVVVAASLLPDIDEPKSYIGHKFWFFAHFLKLLGVKHRTLTHWLITPLILVLIGANLNNAYFQFTLFSVAFGMLAHDVGDMLTKGGIHGFFFPLFPNSKIVLLPNFLLFETFSVAEMIINQFLLISIFVQGYLIYVSQV